MKPQAVPATGRPLARTAAFTALSNIALPLTSLISGPILAHALGPDQRGQMAAAVAPAFVLMFIANMGLPEATTFAIAKLRQDPRVVFLRAISVSIPLGIVAATIFWFAAPHFFSAEMQKVVPLARTIIFLLPLLMMVIILRFAVNGMRNYRAVNTERVLTPMLRLLAFVVLAVTSLLTVRTAALWQMVATIVGGCFLFIALWRFRPDPAEIQPTAPHLTRTLTVYGAKGWGAVLGNLVNWRLDQLVLVALVSPLQLGYYVVAVHFSEIPSTAINAVRNVLFAEAAHRNSAELIARAARVVVLLVAGGGLVAAALASLVIRVLFGKAFLPAVPMALVLLVATVPFCLEQIVAAGTLAERRPGLRSVSQKIVAAITVAGLLLLCPHLGAMGAAITSLIAYTINAAIAVYQFNRATGARPVDVVIPRPADARWVWSRITGILRKRRRRSEQGPAGGAGLGRTAARARRGRRRSHQPHRPPDDDARGIRNLMRRTP